MRDVGSAEIGTNIEYWDNLCPNIPYGPLRQRSVEVRGQPRMLRMLKHPVDLRGGGSSQR
jgi:hypothetical protein